MDPVTTPAEDPIQALILEQARLFAERLRLVSRTAPDGQVLARVEQLVLTEGREFLRRAMRASLEAEGPALEKKGRRPGRVGAAGGAT